MCRLDIPHCMRQCMMVDNTSHVLTHAACTGLQESGPFLTEDDIVAQIVAQRGAKPVPYWHWQAGIMATLDLLSKGH